MPTYAARPVRPYESTTGADTRPRRAVQVWLFLIAALILVMAVVGAATRLTGSGLSITEWQPIVGTLPPLTDADWEVVFEKYRQIPQYQQLNRGMSLAAFKDIFWWEWGHRFLGRVIGFVFLLPFLFFWARGSIPKRLMPKLVGVFALGGLQGFIGWYMVQSGLVDRVSVSQYRLAMHLSLAALIFAAVLWLAFELGPNDRRRIRLQTLPAGTRATAKFLLCLIFAQIALGALVAGMKAGLSHNTWPLMDGKFIPDGLLVMEPWWRNAFENALTVQFNHRMFAYIIAVIGLWHALRTIFAADDERVQMSAGMLAGMIFFQIGLGVWTLLSMVPLDLALAHQAVALLLLAVSVWHVHTIVKS